MMPLIGLTMGDPAGIGPEIVLKALARPMYRGWSAIVFGDLDHLRRTQNEVFRRGSPERGLYLAAADPGAPRARVGERVVRVVDVGGVPPKLRRGKISALAGWASGRFIEEGVVAARARNIDALVTLPIHKESFAAGGWGRRYVGHTEMLTALTKARATALMLVRDNLRAIHVTSHIPLRSVAAALTRARIIETIRLTVQGLRLMGFSHPKVAVCGLNPHAGDGGIMGDEEKRLIAPAVRAAQVSGARIEGPLPADTVWPKVLAGLYDAGVAMYHDQGQIPVKLQGFRFSGKKGGTLSGGVNVTLGLPIIRTSPAHGTAFDLSGTGQASEESLLEAIALAARMAPRK